MVLAAHRKVLLSVGSVVLLCLLVAAGMVLWQHSHRDSDAVDQTGAGVTSEWGNADNGLACRIGVPRPSPGGSLQPVLEIRNLSAEPQTVVFRSPLGDNLLAVLVEKSGEVVSRRDMNLLAPGDAGPLTIRPGTVGAKRLFIAGGYSPSVAEGAVLKAHLMGRQHPNWRGEITSGGVALSDIYALGAAK